MAMAARVGVDVEALYVEYAAEIRAYLQRHLRSGQGDADALAHDVFVKALAAADRYEDRGLNPRAWLYRIARNVLIDHVRRPRREDELLENADHAVTNAGGDHHDTAIDVRALLSLLPERQRAVIEARFFRGSDTRTTAAVVGSTEDAVKKVQARALARMRRILEAPPTMQIRDIPRRGTLDAFCTHCKAEVVVSADTLRCPTCGRLVVDPRSLTAMPKADEPNERNRVWPTPDVTPPPPPIQIAPSRAPSGGMMHVDAIHVETVERTAPAGTQQRSTVRLPAIREVAVWTKATDELIEALERDEAAATADFEAYRAGLEAKRLRAVAARMALSDMRKVRGIVIPDASPSPKSEPSATVVEQGKPWSTKFPSGCIGPNHVGDRTRVKHMARGYCSTCYPKILHAPKASG